MPNHDTNTLFRLQKGRLLLNLYCLTSLQTLSPRTYAAGSPVTPCATTGGGYARGNGSGR